VLGTVAQTCQIADLPKIVLEYTEHQVIEKECPRCHKKNRGQLPKWIEDTAVQYGPYVRALLVHLYTGQFLSYKRIVEFCEAVFGFAPSEGTVYELLQNCSENLEGFEEEVKEKLKEAEVLHCDETGIRMKRTTGWSTRPRRRN
jgi:transposase